MARDRQRAKQRRDRNRRAGKTPDARPPEPDTEPMLEESDPLAHGSAEVDLAHAQVALGRPEEPEPVGVDDDELEAAADAAAGAGMGGGDRGRRAAVATAGSEPAREEHGGGLISRGIAFIRASWRELQRVQWPDRRQVVQATAVVLGFVIIAGAYLGLADTVAQKIIKAIL
jgi:preprotein translocase subunit SecE